ncbi:MAG: lysophospholipid acyltransferase family protein [Bacteroidota bacterium]
MYYFIYSFLWLLSLLPLFFLKLLSKVIFFLLYYVIGYRKKVVKSNLKKSFPNYSDERINLISRKFYIHLSELIIEVIKSISISDKGLEKMISFKNPKILDEIFEKHHSIFLIQGHYCNWEILTILQKHSKYNIYVTYKPLASKSFDRFLRKIRCRFGIKLMTSEETPRTIVKNRNKRNLYGLIADQTPLRSESKYWTKFMNQDALFYLGPEKLSKATGFPVFFLDIKKIAFAKYEIEFIPVELNPKESDEFSITEGFIDLLEKSIYESPEHYLWSHRRWKHKRTNN